MADSSRYTISHTTTVDLPVAGSAEVQLVIPRSKSENKAVPFTVYVSTDGSNTPFGSYVYSMPDNKGKDVYTTNLHDSDETQVDLARNFSQILSKKYRAPSYVNINGDFAMEEFTMLIRAIVREIEGIYNA